MDLFKKFENNEIKNLHMCTGGARVATSVSAANSGPDGCQKDSQQLDKTQVEGQPEGTTMNDYSDWQWECGIANGGGIGVGIASPVGIAR